MPVISVSLPRQRATKLIQLAKKERRPRSQIIQEAIDLYAFEKRWQKIRRSGELIAKRLGIESDDQVERIAG